MQEGYYRQGEWFTDVFVPMLERCAVPSVCLFGNSDWAGLLCRERGGRLHPQTTPRSFRRRRGEVFTIRSRARDAVTNEPLATVDVFACSLVPVCAHKKKDWERCDTRDVATDRGPPRSWTTSRIRLGSGRLRRDAGDRAGDPGGGARLRSIRVLWRRSFTGFGAENSVPPLWVIHAPPRDTVADLCAGGDHVGSIAIRDAIRRWTPRTSLHGHIHESVEMHGGRFLRGWRSRDARNHAGVLRRERLQKPKTVLSRDGHGRAGEGGTRRVRGIAPDVGGRRELRKP